MSDTPDFEVNESEGDESYGLVFLTWFDVQKIHDDEVTKYDGGGPGIRDEGAIRSALHHPQDLFYYQLEEYDWLESERDIVLLLAADYLDRLARQQGFIDGNKRTAFASALEFLKQHGCNPLLPQTVEQQKKIELFVKAIATSGQGLHEIVDFLKKGLLGD